MKSGMLADSTGRTEQSSGTPHRGADLIQTGPGVFAALRRPGYCLATLQVACYQLFPVVDLAFLSSQGFSKIAALTWCFVTE